jgi:hypothetical protein
MRRLVLFSLLILSSCKRTRVTPVDPLTTIPRVPEGGACASTEACELGLVCAGDGRCAIDGALGTTPEGETCDATVACAFGLVCSGAEVCATPGSPGTAAVGESCALDGDCQGGLSCYDDACLGFEVPILESLACPLRETIGDEPFRVLHDRSDADHDDLLQQPFPSDARVEGGFPVLERFPGGPDLEPFGDVAGGVVADFQAAFDDGWGAQGAVFFRVTDLPDTGSVRVGTPVPFEGDRDDPVNLGRGTIGLVDLTAGAPSYGRLAATGWTLRTHQPYLCDPWMALVPPAGEGLRPGHTYGAFVTAGLLGPEGAVPAVEPTFAALLAAAPPADDTAAWDAFAPMRDYLAAEGIDPDHIRGGTVFTVADHRSAGEAIQAASATADVPVADALIACDTLPGPHADPGDPTRGCFGTASAYHEIQGTVPVPHVQSGTAPFLFRADGGAADWSLGSPATVATRDVTFALTVPTGTPPAEGWPIVIFAHDVGENYRSFVVEGLAERWSNLSSGSGAAGFAVLGFDTWLTGPRAGDVPADWRAAFAAADEAVLAYDNPLNPVAARDNLTQSAMDLHTMMRWLDTVDWSASSPAGTPLPLDTGRVWIVGHGIGGRAVPLVAAHAPQVQGVVLSATAGMWSETLTARQEPISAEVLLQPALGDPRIDRLQPVVALGQHVVDRTDAVNHGRFVHFDADVNRDVLVLVGDDPLTGRSAIDALARSLFVEQVVQDGATAIERLETVSGPVSANVVGSTAVALVNVASDPHRMLYDNPRSVVQVDGFLASAALDGRATVPAIP